MHHVKSRLKHSPLKCHKNLRFEVMQCDVWNNFAQLKHLSDCMHRVQNVS